MRHLLLAYMHLMIPSDAFSCKVMLPSDVNASKLKCNVPSSAEKFLLCQCKYSEVTQVSTVVPTCKLQYATQLYMDIAPTGADSKLNVVKFSFTKKTPRYFIKRYTCTSNCHENYTGLEKKKGRVTCPGRKIYLSWTTQYSQSIIS